MGTSNFGHLAVGSEATMERAVTNTRCALGILKESKCRRKQETRSLGYTPVIFYVGKYSKTNSAVMTEAGCGGRSNGIAECQPCKGSPVTSFSFLK